MEKSDFTFEFQGHGHYKVTFTSPYTGKKWSKVITDMELIDLTKGEDTPKKINLNQLKNQIKS